MTNTRTDIPLGYTYSKDGDYMTFKDSKGMVAIYEDSTGAWFRNTYDTQGKILKSEDKYGAWVEFTYDNQGNIIDRKEGVK